MFAAGILAFFGDALTGPPVMDAVGLASATVVAIARSVDVRAVVSVIDAALPVRLVAS